MKLIDVREFENRYVENQLEIDDISINVNLYSLKIKMISARVYFRCKLQKGLPVRNTILHKYYFGKNRPSMWILRKNNSENKHSDATLGTIECHNQVPILFSHSQHKKSMKY